MTSFLRTAFMFAGMMVGIWAAARTEEHLLQKGLPPSHIVRKVAPAAAFFGVLIASFLILLGISLI